MLPARLSLLALAVALSGTAAATPRFDLLSVEDGLSSRTVADVLQDRRGFLWVGTEGGLDRYDGVRFQSYRFDPADPGSLSSSFVQALAEAPDGGLWVGTFGGGLNRLDPVTGRARRYRHDPAAATTLSHDQVTAVWADGATVWAGTTAGLDRLDPASGRVRRYALGGEVGVRRIVPGANGALWLGTAGGVLRFDPATGRARRVLATDKPVWALHRDADGTLWAGLDGGGLVRLAPGPSAPVRYRAAPGGLCGDSVHDLAREPAGALWIATQDGGLCALGAEGAFETFASDPDDAFSLPASDTRTLAFDRSGLLWVGTWTGGLAKMRRTAFEHVRATARQGFRSGNIGGLADAGGGALWVGTYDAGLYRYDPATGRAEQPPAWPRALRTERVRNIVTDRDGAVWATAGTQGLYRRRRGEAAFRLVPLPRDVGTAEALDLDVGPDGTLWAAFYGPGLCRVARGADRLDCPATRWTGRRALRSGLAYALYAAPDGRVWVSLWGSGVDVVEPARGVVASYQAEAGDPDALQENSVASFTRDRSGRLWLSTFGGGLSRFDPALRGGRGGFRTVGLAEGLPDGTVYAALEDAGGRLWLSTNRGLARYDPASGAVTTYGVEDGLQGLEFNGGAFARLADGRFAFGGSEGFNLFRPGAVDHASPPPPVALVGLQVLGAPAPLPAGPLRLSHRQTAFTAEVAALDFTAPSRNRYAFRLSGGDAASAAWTAPTAMRTVSYTNLDPGRYTLHVRASNSDGVWAEEGLVLPVEIRPAWWQRGAVRALAALLAVALFALAVRDLSQRRLRRQVQALEVAQRLQAERERISRDLHDHVGAQLSSLLAGVELARLARTRGAPPGFGDPLDAVEGDARTTMRQLRETIWALHGEAVSLDGFCDRVRADLAARAGALQTEVSCRGGAVVLSPMQALNLYRIAQEAVTNALKYAGATRLAVRLVHDGETVTVEVADDGAFRAPTAQGDGAPGAALGGFGMRSMAARAEALGGTFELDAAAGTTVRVRVPAEAPAGLPASGEAPAGA